MPQTREIKNPAQKGQLIIDEEAAAVVREVFTLFAQGYGKTAIARMLNTGAYQIQLNISVCMVYATSSPKPKTAPFGNTLLSLIC